MRVAEAIPQKSRRTISAWRRKWGIVFLKKYPRALINQGLYLKGISTKMGDSDESGGEPPFFIDENGG